MLYRRVLRQVVPPLLQKMALRLACMMLEEATLHEKEISEKLHEETIKRAEGRTAEAEQYEWRRR